jgi:hypothetical protein
MKYYNNVSKMKNKYQIVTLLVFVIFCQALLGQELNPIVLEMYGLTPVNEKDAHWDIVQSEIERITKHDPNSLTGNKIDYYGLLNVKDANSLFPGWSFYRFVYSMYVKNPSDKNRVSIALGLRYTLAVAGHVKIHLINSTYRVGNSKDFREFLRINDIHINDTNDAKLVWKSFCEIHSRGNRDLKLEKITENKWKLGISSYDQTISSDQEFRTIVTRTNFYEVTTDSNTKQITDWKSTVETSNKRLEKIP